MFEIKIVEESDLPEMMEIWNLYTEVLSSSKKVHTIGTLTTWYQTRHETDHEYYGCYIEDKLRGFMILRKNKIGEIWIKMTAIKPEFQHKGYGRQLIYHALKEAKGLPVLTEVKIRNFDVINTLIIGGFRIIKYDKDSNEYILKFSLGNIDSIIKDW